MLSKNIFDYLKKYKFISFRTEPVNEIDILIFSRISYFPLEIFESKIEGLLINIFQDMNKIKIRKKDFLMSDDYKLFNELIKSPRYHNLKLSNLKIVLDYKTETQFGVLTITHGNTNYISYRGTDESLIGWKEDLNMTFSEVVPSQKLAKNYLHKVWLQHPFKKIVLLGHSKGGNLAVYSAFKSNYFTKNRIKKVYNIDGPGFLKNIHNSKQYQNISDKIINLIPQTSIVGRFLNYDNNLKIVKSNGMTLLQHDLYKWHIKDNKLVYLNKTSKLGNKINKTLAKWLESMTIEERKKTIDILYNIVSANNIKSVKKLLVGFPSELNTMLKNYQYLSEEDKIFMDLINKKFKKAVFSKENDKKS